MNNNSEKHDIIKFCILMQTMLCKHIALSHNLFLYFSPTAQAAFAIIIITCVCCLLLH